MIDYSTIDGELTRWIAEKGYALETRYRDDEVRVFELWSRDRSQRAQIGVTKITDKDVELAIFDGKRKRTHFTAPKTDLLKLLDEAEASAKAWLEGGN